jgi:hypothetical protein
MIVRKLGPREVIDFLPPECDILCKAMRARTAKQKRIVQTQAQAFLRVLKRMSTDERQVFLLGLYFGCPAELPENVHVSLDLLRRYTGFHVGKLKRLLSGMISLGVHCQVRQSRHHDFGTEGEMAHLEWHIRVLADYGGNATAVASEMVNLVQTKYCEECGIKTLLRGDFSQLSTETASDREH